MKKGLSILLVAAALFGFYGSAVNLNDILACKDYWEKAGEESTANMNKLEDGLNQLKENEQAYLDGKEQVADGRTDLSQLRLVLSADIFGKIQDPNEMLPEVFDKILEKLLHLLFTSFCAARKIRAGVSAAAPCFLYYSPYGQKRQVFCENKEKRGFAAPLLIGFCLLDAGIHESVLDLLVGEDIGDQHGGHQHGGAGHGDFPTGQGAVGGGVQSADRVRQSANSVVGG